MRTEYADLEPGARGDLVVWAQQLLMGRGINVKPTGKYGAKTERGIRTVQRREGLPVTGGIDDATWVALLERRPAIIDWSRRGNPDALGGRPLWGDVGPLAVDEVARSQEGAG